MKIGLLDLDNLYKKMNRSKIFPNIPLMKISQYHKNKKDNVEFVNNFYEYDIIYKSKIFTFTTEEKYCLQADKIIQGGSGYDLKNKLPEYIYNQYPDYDLYNIKNIAYGELTKGCPRNCSFCIVSEKDGKKSKKVADLENFWKGQKEIILLDSNLLACKEHREDLLKQLIKSKASVKFSQGIDIRLMTDKLCKLFNQIKIKRIYFAWDDPNDLFTKSKLLYFKDKLNLHYSKKAVYVLTNFNSKFEEDLYRVKWLKENNYDPYVMIYNKDKLDKGHILRKLQRYVNNKFIFRKAKSFKEYSTTPLTK
ncbi:MAG: radical SAM protein [Desulfobacterales bacterium]|nr:radical SAM protein [Desulfobacterales bacterium]